MLEGMKITAMIPVRLGSERLKSKNLVLINGKPMAQYAVEAAIDAGIFDRVVINSEAEIMAGIARQLGVEFYQRDSALAQSDTRSDDVVNDFMQNNSSDITVWVNTTSPLQTGNEICQALNYFVAQSLDSMFTVYPEPVHCMLGDSTPCNFDLNALFVKTQDLTPVKRFVYSVMAWKNEVFKRQFQLNGYAIFCGRTGVFPVSKATSLIVKTQQDIELCQQVMEGRKKPHQIRYYQA